MKIALLGNMNNNNFALLRYFRDLGLDAHLLLAKNDGKKESDHFQVESDTFEIDKWKPYIHQTNISDNIVCAFDFPLSWLLSLRSLIKSKVYNKNIHAYPVSKKYLKNLLKNYTHFIGSGITPAMLQRINKSLTIFCPYATGVEYFGNPLINSIVNHSGILAKIIFKFVKIKQKKGLLNSKFVINWERSLTENTLKEIGVISKSIFLPVYLEKNSSINVGAKEFDYIDEVLKKSSFSIISTARLLWKKPINYSDTEWLRQNKNNDRLIRAFAKLKSYKQQLNPLLILFEYGPDIQSTKKLINLLGINENILWLPKMNRKFIYKIISKVDLGIGEFHDTKYLMWGATAVEIMGMGKPVIQAFDYTEIQFKKTFKTDLPPILAARTENEIFNQLLSMSNSNKNRINLGRLSKIWFDNNMGIQA
ncbi:glycosyltransferase, partial [Candidatus Pelagibacter sp.]|nr:glycosyltransferase [Candidatus Pelagibacter sp.]